MRRIAVLSKAREEQKGICPWSERVRSFSAIGVLLPALALLVLVGCLNISTIDPPDACEGEEVILSGNGFGSSQDTSMVSFNGVDGGTATDWSETSIVIAVPSGATTGPVMLTVSGTTVQWETFRVVECPAPGTTVNGTPRIDVDSSGQPHILFAQADSTLHYTTRSLGSWIPSEFIDALGSNDFDLAVTTDGTSHVIYHPPTPEPPPIASPTHHRVRTGGTWSAPNVPCPGVFMSSESCGNLQLAMESDDLPALFSTSGDRYGNNWIKHKKFNGVSWSGSTTLEYASSLFYIQGYDAIIDHLGTWHLGMIRSHFELPLEIFRRVEHSAGGSKATLGQEVAGEDSFSVPSLAGSVQNVHLVWRDHAELLHRKYDITTSSWDPGAVVFHTLSSGSSRPLVTPDPSMEDGLFALWLEGGILYVAVYDPGPETWSPPNLVVTDATGPDVRSMSGMVHIVWRGATNNDLRYITLP